MEFYKDLLPSPKNKRGLIFGIIWIIISVLWLVVRIPESKMKVFDTIYFSTALANGIVWVLNGLGYRIEKLFGKAFIKIDDKIISIKNRVLKPEKEIAWNEISKIIYHLGAFTIEKKDGNKFSLPVGELEFTTIQEVKNVIKNIAEQKNIEYNSN